MGVIMLKGQVCILPFPLILFVSIFDVIMNLEIVIMKVFQAERTHTHAYTHKRGKSNEPYIPLTQIKQ